MKFVLRVFIRGSWIWYLYPCEKLFCHNEKLSWAVELVSFIVTRQFECIQFKNWQVMPKLANWEFAKIWKQFLRRFLSKQPGKQVGFILSVDFTFWDLLLYEKIHQYLLIQSCHSKGTNISSVKWIFVNPNDFHKIPFTPNNKILLLRTPFLSQLYSRNLRHR